MFLYLLGIPLSLPLVLIAEFGVSFLYSGSLWSSLYCGISSLCVGLYRWLVKVSWLGKLMSVFWWVELDFFSLLSKTMGCFSGCLMSSAGIQKLFCGIYLAFKCSFDEFVGEKVFSPSYSSTIFNVLVPLLLLLCYFPYKYQITKSGLSFISIFFS